MWGKWQEFEALCPFGPLQDATYFGVLASMLHWAHKAESEPHRGPEKYFPQLKWVFGPRQQTPEEFAREQHRIAAQLFGTG